MNPPQAPYRQHFAAPPPAASVTVCRSCGAVAPTEGAACEGCGRPVAEGRIQVSPQSADSYWVAVKCGFTCNQCRFLAPLDGLDADGAVDCAHCGLRQRFDVPQWTAALEHAHAVGDLAGPEPEGRAPHPAIWIGDENPHATIGVTRTFAKMLPEKVTVPNPAASTEEDAAIAPLTLTTKDPYIDIQACPGHPVCKRCRVPLSCDVTSPGAVTTRCPSCSEEARYILTEAAFKLSPGLVAAVADEHRSDKPRAQPMPTQQGIFALKCPGCGAPLHLQGDSKVQTCSYCKATCFVAARSLAQVNHKTPEPEIWWLLFRGPSPLRAQLTSAIPDTPSPGKDVIAFLKPTTQTDTIKDAPGVYEAPERPGPNWPQVLLTVVLGTLAAAIGYLFLGR